MSFLKELKIENSINRFNLEEYIDRVNNIGNTNISNEAFTEYILFKSIDYLAKDFQNLYNFTKGLITSWLHDDKQRKKIYDLVKLTNIDYISDKEVNDLIHAFFSSRIVSLKRLNYIFTPRGKIQHFPSIINTVKREINDLIKEAEKEYKENSHNGYEFNENEAYHEYNEIESVILGSNEFNKTTFTKNSVFENFKDIPKWYDETIKFYKQEIPYLDKKVKMYEKRVIDITKKTKDIDISSKDPNDKEMIGERLREYNRFMKYKVAVKLAFLPSSMITALVRLIAYLTKTMVDVEYTSTTKRPAKTMYHLSSNPKLPDVLAPREAGTNLVDFLPPRVSFGETILGCCYGIPKYFREGYTDTNEKNIAYRDIYAYIALPEEGKTTYLKPELVRHSVLGTIWQEVKEVCITSEIKVKLESKVRIYFRKDLEDYTSGKFVRYEVLESY